MRERDGPASPCVSVCALDGNDLCIGCLRTGEEIAQWGAMNNQQKSSVLKRVADREAASTFGIEIGRQQ